MNGATGYPDGDSTTTNIATCNTTTNWEWEKINSGQA